MWEQLVDCICRPPRDSYEENDLIGGASKQFKIGRCKGKREDCVIVNKKGQQICCSFYKPVEVTSKDGKLPCVVYCHCNSGSMRDAEEAVYLLLPMGVAVFAFDFTGSGRSDGEYVTLGSNEADDLAVVIEHLRASGNISTIGLWGRSMGAVTSLIYSQRDPSIAGMVLDSPFSRLTDLMLEIVEGQKLPIPKAVTKLAVSAMRRSVKKRAQFDINTVNPIDKVPEAFIPALFGHGEQDNFININHSVKLHELYAGDKNMVRFEGDHNSRRPEFFYSSVSIFLHNVLRLSELLEDAPHDTSTLRANSNQSYRLHGRAVSARQLNQLAGPWMCSQADVTSALQELTQDPGWDEGDVILQQVLELSIRDAQAANGEGGSSNASRSSISTPSKAPDASTPSTATSSSAAARPAQSNPSAAPGHPGAFFFEGMDEDEMLRAAIEASLQDSQPVSTSTSDPAGSSGKAMELGEAEKRAAADAAAPSHPDPPVQKLAELQATTEQKTAGEQKTAAQQQSQQQPSTAGSTASGPEKLTGADISSAAGDTIGGTIAASRGFPSEST